MAQNDDKKNPAPAAPTPAALTIDADTIRKIAQEVAVAAVMAAQQTVNMKAQQVAENNENCGHCGQKVKGCLGKHAKMVVLPRTTLGKRYFQGIRLNGVLYMSPNSQTPIIVPEQNDFAYILQQHDAQEESFPHGKQYMHDSGSVNAPRMVNPAQVPWQPV